MRFSDFGATFKKPGNPFLIDENLQITGNGEGGCLDKQAVYEWYKNGALAASIQFIANDLDSEIAGLSPRFLKYAQAAGLYAEAAAVKGFSLIGFDPNNLLRVEGTDTPRGPLIFWVTALRNQLLSRYAPPSLSPALQASMASVLDRAITAQIQAFSPIAKEVAAGSKFALANPSMPWPGSYHDARAAFETDPAICEHEEEEAKKVAEKAHFDALARYKEELAARAAAQAAYDAWAAAPMPAATSGGGMGTALALAAAGFLVGNVPGAAVGGVVGLLMGGGGSSPTKGMPPYVPPEPVPSKLLTEAEIANAKGVVRVWSGVRK